MNLPCCLTQKSMCHYVAYVLKERKIAFIKTHRNIDHIEVFGDDLISGSKSMCPYVPMC